MRRFVPLLCAALTACGDDVSQTGADDTSTGSGSTSGTATTQSMTGVDTSSGSESSTGGALPEIDWDSCPVGFESECAYIPVPINRDDPGSVQIAVMISRRPAPSGTTDAQLWMMQGGPGGSADAFALVGIHEQLAELLPNVDVYTIEHRGVGESARLACGALPPQTADEIQDCAAFLDEAAGGALSSFSTSEAARDLQYMLRLADEDGQAQFVYGVSYGSFWAHRFLQLFPDEAEGVILDSVAAPVQDFNDYDTQADPVAMRMADACAADPICSDKMGNDPWTTVGDTMTALEGGQCAAVGLTGEIVTSIFWSFLADRELREVIFPLLYRLQRCDPLDTVAAGNFLEYLPTHGPDFPPDLPQRFSPLLQANISISEFWARPYSADDLLAACDEAIICPRLSEAFLPYVENWPNYDEPLASTWHESATPILSYNGDLDPQTAIETASQLQDHLSGPHQNFYEFPDAPHWIIYVTPVQTEGEPTCGLQMLRDFVTDPSSPPDASCLDDLVLVDVAGTEEKALQFFDTVDMWENQGGQIAPDDAPHHAPVQWLQATERLRQRLGPALAGRGPGTALDAARTP